MMIESKGLSDVGMKRNHNEDSFVVRPDIGLFAVADGMGGHVAGGLASSIAIEAILNFVESSLHDKEITWPFGMQEGIPEDALRLITAIRIANKKIYDFSKEKDEYYGMGTTIVGMLVRNNFVHFAHVGDSRAYSIKNNSIIQITDDHSWINEQIKSGALSAEQALHHPHKNIITRSLGRGDDVKVDFISRPVENEEYFLLCSDGLSGMLGPEEINNIVMQNKKDLDRACKSLIEKANSHGGDDNITAIIVRLGNKM